MFEAKFGDDLLQISAKRMLQLKMSSSKRQLTETNL